MTRIVKNVFLLTNTLATSATQEPFYMQKTILVTQLVLKLIMKMLVLPNVFLVKMGAKLAIFLQLAALLV